MFWIYLYYNNDFNFNISFYLLGKLFEFIIKFLCLKEKNESINKVKKNFKNNYKLFEPYFSKKEIKNQNKYFKSELLIESQKKIGNTNK